MTTNTAPAPAPRRAVLLIKAQGDFKHSGKYFLQNGRWHALHQDKPAPKGAPVSAHKHAAGQFVPKQHFTDAEWDQLKLPAENQNAGTFNKQLDQLKQHSDSGNVTAILGGGYGVNTYGKKLATVANHLLGLYGSEHKVTPGQKAGEHAAVQQAQDDAPAPAAPDTPAAAPKVEQPAPNTGGLPMPAFVEGKTTNGVVSYYEKQAQKILDMAAAGDADGLAKMKAEGLKPNGKGKVSNTFAGKTANSKLLLALHDQAVDHVGKKVEAVMEANPPSPEPAPSQMPVKDAEPAAPEPAAEPAPASQATAAAPKLSQIPWDSLLLPDSNKNAKSHNGKVAQIKAMAEAGDIAGLEAFKAGTNTYGKKQNLLAQTALAALKEDAAEPATAPAAEAAPAKTDKSLSKPQGPRDLTGHSGKKADVDAALNSGDKEALAKIIDESDGSPPETNLGKVHAYAKQALDYLNASPAVEEGPKEGDTKQGADGMLVFKNGRWHKSVPTDEHGEMPPTLVPVDQPEPAAAEPEAQAAPHPIDAVPMPELTFSSPASNAKVAAALEKLKEQIKQEGPGALKGVTKHMKAKGKYIVSLPGQFGKLKVYGYEGMPDHAGSKVHAYVEALKAAAGKPSKKPKAAPAATAAPHADQNAIPSMDDWKQIGPQGGSNPGGKFVDEHGTEWYCKFPGNDDVAKSEVLAAKLYAAAGVAGQDAMLVTKGGKLGIASKWQSVQKASSPAALAKVDGVASGFAADAWLGNWDVVGLGYDNLQVDAAGKAMRVDAGGSLEYRAQGGKKSFGNVVTELDSLRDKAINPQSAAVFGKLSNADITAGVAKVLKVSDAQIYALVNTFGPGDAAHKKSLAETLIARKADLLAKFPKAKKEKKHTFKPEKISAPPSFLNWGGSGKDGPSSKPFLNQANEKAVQSIYEAAKTGSIDAVKNLAADTFNKNTGEVTGSAPVLEHPSQHVKGYAQQAINEINYQLNPPKRFRFEGGHPLESLHAAYPSHTGGVHADTVEKAGKFLVLGEPGKVSLDSLALPKITHASGQLTKATYSPAAQAAINAMPETQKQAIKQYTGSSYLNMNTSLWTGNPSGAAKAAAEALKTMGHEIKPGTVLSRKLSVSGEGLDQILKSTGKVLQEPAIMSTSIRPSSWSGNVHLKLHVGPGVKGLWVGPGSAGAGKALSVNAGEDELVLPPNTRLLILSVKKSNGADADGFGASSQHVIEAVVLPTQQAH
ncbi:ADP-ribosyltransferase [Pseudomonas phage Dolphis]|nr:ADP-ribosyltransferase [Pseudomonas phage Dolphis]